jgi:hypothetical protein
VVVVFKVEYVGATWVVVVKVVVGTYGLLTGAISVVVGAIWCFGWCDCCQRWWIVVEVAGAVSVLVVRVGDKAALTTKSWWWSMSKGRAQRCR